MDLKNGSIYITNNLKEAIINIGGDSNTLNETAKSIIGIAAALKDMPDIERAKSLYSAADRIIAEAIDQEDSICKRGCHYCCYQYIGASKTEAALIKDFIKKRNIKLSYKKLKWQSKFRQPIDYWNAYGDRTRCVFLNKDNDCDIYPVRPLTCRSYFSAMLDPTFCKPDGHTDKKTMGVKSIPKVEVLISALATFEQDKHKYPLDAKQMFYSLPALLLELKENHEI